MAFTNEPKQPFTPTAREAAGFEILRRASLDASRVAVAHDLQRQREKQEAERKPVPADLNPTDPQHPNETPEEYLARLVWERDETERCE